MIEITNLTKYQGKKSVICNFSLTVQRKECVGIFGRQGAGKSTLLNLIAGLIKPSSGYVMVQGFNTLTQSHQVKSVVGYQLAGGLNHHTLSVKGFLNFVAGAHGYTGIEKRQKVDRAATLLELLPLLDHPIDTLPPGLKRQLAIAGAVLHGPGLLLLDEPGEGLSPDQASALKTLIQSLAEEMTLVIACRQCEELSSLCTRALVIADGQLAADSSPQELKSRSRHFQAVTLTAQPPLDLLALAVLPGVAGIEEDLHSPGTVTVLAMPGQTIYPAVNALIASRGWNITSMALEPGRINDVVRHLSQENTL
ncbi:ATP-binding cassette domain-containing protein [Pseudomonas sp. SDO524_S393]